MVDGTVVSRPGMVKDNDHTCFICSFCVPIIELFLYQRHVQNYSTRSVQALPAREAPRLGPGPNLVRDNKCRKSLSFSASGKSAVRGVPGLSGRLRRLNDSWYEEKKGDGRTKNGCRKPNVGFSSSKKTECPCDF